MVITQHDDEINNKKKVASKTPSPSNGNKLKHNVRLNNENKPLQILLGITGSVASVKGPELALELAKSLHARVIVVMTVGGTNFWYKAKDYNKSKWEEYCSFMNGSTSTNVHSNDDDQSGTTRVGLSERSVFSMLEVQDVHIEQETKDSSFPGEIAICRKFIMMFMFVLIHIYLYIYISFILNNYTTIIFI